MNTKCNTAVPVVFIHFGNIPNYLINAINQAVSFNNDEYLLTDNTSIKTKAKLAEVKTINTDEESFKSYYKHMSTNTFEFEYMCIYRWFILKNFMISHSVKKVLYLDSDVYLYVNVTEIISNYPNFEFAYSVPEVQKDFYWAGSACSSFWSNDAIKAFCELIKLYYTSDNIKILETKWDYHSKEIFPGGICDMTFLYFFSKEPEFLNLAKVYNECCFDFNNAISINYKLNEYEYNQGDLFDIPTKKIKFIRAIPYCYNTTLNKTVHFFALTEYAKLLEFNKKRTFIYRVTKKIYSAVNKIFN